MSSVPIAPIRLMLDQAGPQGMERVAVRCDWIVTGSDENGFPSLLCSRCAQPHQAATMDVSRIVRTCPGAYRYVLPNPSLDDATPPEPDSPEMEQAAAELSIPKPSLLSMGWRFWQELRLWWRAGRPVRSDAVVERLYATCRSGCNYFEPSSSGYGNCGVCGCFVAGPDGVMNAARWETKDCPHPGGSRWAKEAGFTLYQLDASGKGYRTNGRREPT